MFNYSQFHLQLFINCQTNVLSSHNRNWIKLYTQHKKKLFVAKNTSWSRTASDLVRNNFLFVAGAVDQYRGGKYIHYCCWRLCLNFFVVVVRINEFNSQMVFNVRLCNITTVTVLLVLFIIIFNTRKMKDGKQQA